MNEKTINATPIFKKNAKATSQIVINRGGAGSSKSYSVLQLIAIYFLSLANLRILILRKTLPANKNSCLVMFKKILTSMDINFYTGKPILFLKTELEFHNKGNGSYVKFASLQEPERIKSSEWDFIVMEEATEFSYIDFSQCKLRLTRTVVNSHIPQIFMMLNPNDEFSWIKEKVVDARKENGEKVEDYCEIVSTYKDNPFLSKKFISDLENTINLDPSWYAVYCLGEWRNLGNTIYGKFILIEPHEFPPITEEACLGLDLGMVNETALVLHMLKSEVEMYEKELIYQSNTELSDIIRKMDKDFPFIKKLRLPIYVDYGGPGRGAIEQLQREGYNAYAANKDVFDGLNFCRKFIYYITSDSVNLIKEHKAYSWQVNKNGIPLDKPIKVFDHLMDARRYSVYTHFFDKIGIKPSDSFESEPEYNIRSRVFFN